MTIPAGAWSRYRTSLSVISKQASDAMAAYIERIGGFAGHEREIVAYAYSLASTYGEATGALACELYDAIAMASNASVPAAEPAETATYAETAQAVYGTAKQSEAVIPQTIGRLVKQVSADTMLQNAARDGAQFAWIPGGSETCAFCITLASRGWQNISKRTLRKGHAEHIHANCDCNYVVRHNTDTDVRGYDPEEYLAAYTEASGAKPKDKINTMRRELYQQNKEAINAQKRRAYAERQAMKLMKAP